MFLAKFFVSSIITLALFSGSVSPVFADDNGGKSGRNHHSNKSLNQLVSQGSLTQTQLEAFKMAMKAKIDDKFNAKLKTVLNDLVNKNLLTQVKADLINSSVSNKHGFKDLVDAGTITKSDAQLIHSTLKALPKENISTLRDQVLTDLVNKNILTQTQAQVIKNVKQSWVKKLGKHRGAALGTADNVSLTF